MQEPADTRAMIGAPFVAVVLLLLVYLATLARGLAGGDTPEMITAAYHLGVPHQPGYPLYVLLGRVFALLPVGGIALRVTLLSAIPCALAGGMLCRLLVRTGVAPVSAVLLSVIAGLSWMPWSQAVVAEVYALGLFLGLLALERADAWRSTGNVRHLLVAAYVGGLAVSHQPLAVWLLPGALYIIADRMRAATLQVRTLLAAAALFVLPFSAFALLPIRSAAAPAIDYAQIESVGDFFYHALGRASGSELLSEGGEGVRRTLALFGEVALGASGPLTILVVLIALVGVGRMARRDRERFVLFGVPLLLLLGFALVYAILDVENYLILPFWLLVLAAGGALAGGAGWRRTAASIVLLAVAVTAGVANRERCDRSDYRFVDDFVRNTLECVPARGALFLYTEVLVGPFAYHTRVEGLRPDVEIVDMTGKVLPQPYGFREITGDWREGRWLRMEALHASPPPALDGRPFTTLMIAPRDVGDRLYRRRGLVFELLDADSAPPAVSAASLWDRFAIRMPHPELVRTDRTAFSLTPTIRRFYGRHLSAVADESLAAGDYQRAIRSFRLLLDFVPLSVAAREGLALAYSRTGRPMEAEMELRKVIEINPAAPRALNALGVMALSRGVRDSAEVYFLRALDVDAELPLTHFNLGMLLAQDPGRAREAAHHLRAFIRLAPSDPDVVHAREALTRISGDDETR